MYIHVFDISSCCHFWWQTEPGIPTTVSTLISPTVWLRYAPIDYPRRRDSCPCRPSTSIWGCTRYSEPTPMLAKQSWRLHSRERLHPKGFRSSTSNQSAQARRKTQTTGTSGLALPMAVLLSIPHRHVARFGGKASRLIQAECLFQYDEPVSPHLAARLKDPENANVRISKWPFGLFFTLSRFLQTTSSSSLLQPGLQSMRKERGKLHMSM